METPDLTMTWGFEFEFLLAFQMPIDTNKQMADGSKKRKNRRNAHMELMRIANREGHRARRRLVGALRRMGILVNAYDAQATGYETSQWTVDMDGSITTDEESEDTTHVFASGRDFTVPAKWTHGLRYAEVEVMSRILPASRDSLVEVRRVLLILLSFPTRLNESCGFHVHIGNQNKGFGKQTVKNLMSLLCAGMYQFDELHPEHRLTNDYCLRLQTAFEPLERDPFLMTKIIREFRTLEELCAHFTTERDDRNVTNHYWSLNLINLVGRPDRKTIEWRQHEGTLDMNVVNRWISLASTIIMKSNCITNPFFWLNLNVQEPEYSLHDLLLEAGLPGLAEQLRLYLYRHDRDVPISDAFAASDLDDEEIMRLWTLQKARRNLS